MSRAWEATGSLADAVAHWARERPRDTAIVCGPERVTWAQLDAVVDALADHLLDDGLVRGDRVALALGNGVPFATAYLAIQRAGLTAVPLNPGLTQSEVRPLLAGIRLLITAPDSASLAAAGSVDTLVVGRPEWLATLMASVDPVRVDPADLAVLLYTAGSTGRPKAAGLTQQNLLANIRALAGLTDPPAILADDVVLVVLPMFHVYGLNAVFGLAIATGATCVILDRFDAAETLTVIAREGVTVIAGAPPMFVALQREPNVREACVGVRLISCGGAPLPPEAASAFADACGHPIWEGYGMTETSPVITTSLVLGRPRPGWVGAPLPGLEIRVNAERGDPGEVAVRGPSVFAGYWVEQDGQLVGPVGGPDDEGWFPTGDIGYRDDEGDLRLVDRRRELILVNGFNVYPREIELVAEQHPAVAEAAVVGVPDTATGEAVRAYVVLHGGAAFDHGEFTEFCRSRLARFKCPSEVILCDSLPRSATGKVAKGRLREVYGT